MMHIKRNKDGGRPKIVYNEVVRKDMIMLFLSKNVTLNRVEWKKRIHITKPKT